MSRHWNFKVSSVSPKKKEAMAETEAPPEAYNMTFTHEDCGVSATLKMPSTGIYEEKCDRPMDPQQAYKLAKKICSVIDRHTGKPKKTTAKKKRR